MLDWFLGWLPENASSFGDDIDSAISLVTWIVFIWWLVAEGILFGFLFFYRKKDGKKAHYETGETMKAMSWVLVPVFFVFIMDIIIDVKSHDVWDKVKIQLPKSELTYKVIGAQFDWSYIHPGLDGKFNTNDDFEPDDFTIPLKKVVHVQLTSVDVLHSFWIPNFRYKQDVVPGRTITGWMEATKVGEYEIACAELCGVGHGVMASVAKVMPVDEYNQWVTEMSEAAIAENSEEEEE